MTIYWETRLRGNQPKFIDIFPVGAADSSGAIARVPIRDGYFRSNQKTAALIAAAPDLLEALEHVVSAWSEQFERYGNMAPNWAINARKAIALAKAIQE